MGPKLKTYVFDIDGTICSNTFGEYAKAEPLRKRINLINKLFDQGNIIKLFTARGSTTKIDWEEFWKVVKGNGPMNNERISSKKKAWDEGLWVRNAARAHASKNQSTVVAAE